MITCVFFVLSVLTLPTMLSGGAFWASVGVLNIVIWTYEVCHDIRRTK